MKSLILGVLGVAILFLFCAHSTFAFSPKSEVRSERVVASLISSLDQVRVGQTFYAGLHFKIIPDWHIYWKNPGDSGEPPRYQWKLPPHVQAGDILWPAPKRFPLSVLANYGYEKNVLLPVKIEVPRDIRESLLKIQLYAQWLVCKEECIPEEGHFEVLIPLSKDTHLKSSHFTFFEETLKRVPQEIGDFESHFEKSTETRLKISIARHQLSLSSPDFDYEIFPVDLGVFDAGTDTLSSHNANSLNFEMTLAPQISEPPREIRFLLKANSQRPDQEDVALEFKSSLQTMSSQASKEAPKISWLWALVGAFLGGLLLNLMPCVLPVLSLKAFSLVKQSASPSVKWEGLAYSAGVMLSFLSLAILLLLLRSGGEALGWGFQLQNPVFVIAMAWLFVILALQFFEVFEMGESLQNWVGRSGSSQKKGLGTSFLSGVLATLIASPCTAPFMGSAIGFALTLPTVPSLLIFTLLGFGMALPILLLSFFPKTLRLLPTPGAWMNRFKQFMGFPMLATSFWLLWVYGKQTDGDAVIRFLFSSLSLALTLWILGQFKSQWKRHLSVLLSLTLTLWLAWPLIFTQNSKARSSTQQSTQDYSGIPYENFSANKRDEALRQGRPVYVDFTATWCLLCQVNKRVVFPEAQVQELFRSKNILLLKADWTDKNESLLRELESFGRSGVPLNVYYDPKSSKPIVLPSVLRPQSVVDAISQTSP